MNEWHWPSFEMGYRLNVTQIEWMNGTAIIWITLQTGACAWDWPTWQCSSTNTQQTQTLTETQHISIVRYTMIGKPPSNNELRGSHQLPTGNFKSSTRCYVYRLNQDQQQPSRSHTVRDMQQLASAAMFTECRWALLEKQLQPIQIDGHHWKSDCNQYNSEHCTSAPQDYLMDQGSVQGGVSGRSSTQAKLQPKAEKVKQTLNCYASNQPLGSCWGEVIESHRAELLRVNTAPTASNDKSEQHRPRVNR